jgi:hypothetical protein
MKIKVTHTYDLSPSEVAALKIYWKEMREEYGNGVFESFRDWLRSYHNAAGSHYVYDKIAENEEYT